MTRRQSNEYVAKLRRVLGNRHTLKFGQQIRRSRVVAFVIFLFAYLGARVLQLLVILYSAHARPAVRLVGQTRQV